MRDFKNFLFLVGFIPVLAFGQVSQVEYFFDSDPGFGNGTPITVSAPDSLLLLPNEVLNSSGLSLGFHNLFVRSFSNTIVYEFFDDGTSTSTDTIATWGHYESRLVFVDLDGSVVVDIDAIEYFFDVDAGYGAGTIISVTPSNLQNLTEALNSSGLTLGFHNLFIRARDSGGTWGQAVSRLVYVDQSAAITDDIDAIEYFFDADPGYGNGTIVNVTPATQVNFSDSLVSSNQPIGFHNLFVRIRDNGGTWGQAESRLVYVDQSGSILDEIDAYEYFFDSDPGYGNGTLVEVTPSTIINISDSLDGTSLTIGFHNLYVRLRDSGGTWGQTESRLVYVDQSGALIADIDAYEYFFDVDPGYGNGAFVSLTAGPSVLESDTLSADTLSIGFHNLYTRFRDIDGQWGLAESRLVVVDFDGNLVASIEELEYFFDTDPGYGLAQSIPISPPEEIAARDFNISTASLGEGEHTLFMRAKNSNGVWGLSKPFLFNTFGLGRQLDSIALAYAYSQLDGENWVNNTGWLTGPLDTWEGIAVNNNRVDSVSLSANQLVGSIPFQLSYLSEMRSLDVSINQLLDSVPLAFEDLAALQALKLNGNQLHELPDLSGLVNLSVAHLDSNLFDFGDLEPLAAVPTFTYSNQEIYSDQPVDSLVNIGQALNWTVPVEGVNNLYQWYLNDGAVDFADLANYELTAFSQEDTGTYRLEVNNFELPNLTLNSANYRFRISGFEQDSLAMVSLYESTDGLNWTDQTNWLSGSLFSWHGITIDQDRISELNLPNNNLSGILPADMAVANALTVIDLSQNNLRDSVPGSINEVSGLVSLNLASNDLNSIPSMALLQTLSTLNVSGNRIQFGDLETNLGINNLIYSPMDSLTVSRDTLMETGDNVSLEFDFSGANNNYQWYKSGVALDGATANRLDIQAIDFDDEGTYRLEVTNALITDLTLTSGELRVGATSLERDQAALRALYQQTAGENWDPPVNWLTDEIEQWGEEVTLNSNNTRVISVSLPSRGLTGEMPSIIRDITSLEAFDVSGNNLTSFPNMSQMPNLASLDVRQNQLQIPDIERNITVSGVSFNPQQKVVVLEDTLLISQGTSTVLTHELAGNNIIYFWKRDGQEIAETSQMSYVIDSITYDNMGRYTMEATSSTIREVDAAFRLVTQDQWILATANIEFFPTFSFADGTEALVESGTSALVGVRESGPFPIVDSVDIVNERIFFPSIILGDYLLSTRAADDYIRILNGDTVQFIPTYFENELEWDSADVLTLREDLSDALLMLRIPPPLKPIPGNDGIVEMTVESDFSDDNGARLEARRRVRKAGCSLRRNTTRTGGRSEDEEEWELIAYKETDGEGNVDFGFLPNGLYRINIQYPGVPMDPNSFIEFEITEEEEKDGYVLSATIFEDRIEVVVIEELGFVREYFKNLNVYPNPANEEIRITYAKLNSKDVSYQLTDLSGQVMLEGNVEKGQRQETRLETAGVQDGLYFLRFYDRKHNRKHLITYKVIVRH